MGVNRYKEDKEPEHGKPRPSLERASTWLKYGLVNAHLCTYVCMYLIVASKYILVVVLVAELCCTKEEENRSYTHAK